MRGVGPATTAIRAVAPALPQAEYEGGPVAPDPNVVAAMAPALERVRALRDAARRRARCADTAHGGVDSPLGNLFADAQRERTGADVAISNNLRGGLRADLPSGQLTFGRLYDVFPFDNRVARVALERRAT